MTNTTSTEKGECYFGRRTKKPPKKLFWVMPSKPVYILYILVNLYFLLFTNYIPKGSIDVEHGLLTLRRISRAPFTWYCYIDPNMLGENWLISYSASRHRVKSGERCVYKYVRIREVYIMFRTLILWTTLLHSISLCLYCPQTVRVFKAHEVLWQLRALCTRN